MLIRQGDVLLEKIDKEPEGFYKVRENNVVAYGEVTGHSHRLTDGVTKEYVEGLVLSAFEGSQLVHDEHDPIDLDPGFYAVTIQREYTAGDVRRVLD